MDTHEDGEEVVFEGAYGAFSGVALVHVWGYEVVSDIPVFLNDTILFSDDFVINNLEVELVDLQSEVVHNGVVGCNTILVLLSLEVGNKDCVGVTMVGVQDVLINAARSDGEAPIVVCVDLGYWFVPNVHFVQADGVGVGGGKISLKSFCSFDRIFGIGFGGPDYDPLRFFWKKGST